MKLFSSHSTVLGLFTLLIVLTAIPTVLLFAEQKKEKKIVAPEPTITPQAVLPSQVIGFIEGYVYLDQNDNREREQDEKPLPDIPIQITQVGKTTADSSKKIADVTTEVRTDANGYFKLRFSRLAPEVVTYVIKLSPTNGATTSTPNPMILPDLHPDSQKIVEFGVFSPILPTPDPRVTLSKQQSPKLSPTPDCLPRPVCLDNIPKCMIAEPADGWCPTTKNN